MINNTIKQQQSWEIEMRYFRLLGQKNDRYFEVCYKPGVENMGNYPSKSHTGTIHKHVRPYYMHMESSPRTLLRAHKPSSRQGCVEILGSPYYKGVPLPRIPSNRKLGKSSRIAQRSVYTTFWSCGQYSISIGTAQFATKIQPSRRRAVLRCVRRNSYQSLSTVTRQ